MQDSTMFLHKRPNVCWPNFLQDPNVESKLNQAEIFEPLPQSSQASQGNPLVLSHWSMRSATWSGTSGFLAKNTSQNTLPRENTSKAKDTKLWRAVILTAHWPGRDTEPKSMTKTVLLWLGMKLPGFRSQ